jgi:hypothetical protein
LKTVTVREAAQALGITKRAVMYRLADKKLNGRRVTNDSGQVEWRIYPTKEIAEKLGQISAEPSQPEASSVNDDFFDAETIDLETSEVEETFSPDIIDERARMKTLADELVRPILERLDHQTRLLIEKEKEIDDLKIKLLPDLQKIADEERKAAEQERKTAELKELEILALKQQIAAMEEEKISLLSKQTDTKQNVSWFKKWFLPREV